MEINPAFFDLCSSDSQQQRQLQAHRAETRQVAWQNVRESALANSRRRSITVPETLRTDVAAAASASRSATVRSPVTTQSPVLSPPAQLGLQPVAPVIGTASLLQNLAPAAVEPAPAFNIDDLPPDSEAASSPRSGAASTTGDYEDAEQGVSIHDVQRDDPQSMHMSTPNSLGAMPALSQCTSNCAWY